MSHPCSRFVWDSMGADQSVDTMKVMKDELPATHHGHHSGFPVCKCQWPPPPWQWAGMCLSGSKTISIWIKAFGHKRQLVERAREIIERMGARVLTAEEARQKLGLIKQS